LDATLHRMKLIMPALRKLSAPVYNSIYAIRIKKGDLHFLDCPLFGSLKDGGVHPPLPGNSHKQKFIIAILCAKRGQAVVVRWRMRSLYVFS